MSNTNWKNLGKKQGANMKNYRNVRMDKVFYNNGKWDTVYSTDDIKRLAYYNVDLPHVVGIGTKRPFSKLSFGDSTDSGEHITTDTITPGKVTAIAMHEKSISKALDGSLTSTLVEGQDFTGFSYVNKLKSVRKRIDNDNSASGVAIYANKSSEDKDTSLKTNKGILYVTDDNLVHIGGVPKEFDLIDNRAQKFLPGNAPQGDGIVETGPNILLDVSGSIHVNGFINFLRKGTTANRDNDNPAGQMTWSSETGIVYVDSNDQDQITERSVPEGAIWVGFNKRQTGTNFNLEQQPRLYIQYEGKNTKVLTEEDSDIIENIVSGAGGGGSGDGEAGYAWQGDLDTNGEASYYAFRQPSDNPGNTIINTYIGRINSNAPNTTAIDFGKNNNPLPRLLRAPGTQAGEIGDTAQDTDATASALTIVGNLSVFDFTQGGPNAAELDGSASGELNDYRKILQSDIYNNTTVSNKSYPGQRELGSIYTDRHIMVGGITGDGNTVNARFEHFTSAIDISGGIHKKPAIRVLTGDKDGSLTAGSNCRDSIIIGNTTVSSITGNNTESIIVGEHNSIAGVENSIVQGSENNITDISNSLVIGKKLNVGQSGTTMDGIVVLGDGGTGLSVAGDDRIVFATNDGTSSKKALTIDKNAKVTIDGTLQVTGEKILLEMEHVVAKDIGHELNGKEKDNVTSGNHETDSAGQLASTLGTTNNIHEGGMKLYLGAEDDQTHFAQWTFDERNNVAASYNNNQHQGGEEADRWTTAMSSREVGLAAAAQIFNNKGVAGSEKFIVSRQGNLYIGTGGTLTGGGTLNETGEENALFTVEASSGNVDMSGNLKVYGNVTAGPSNNAGIFQSNGSIDVILQTGSADTGSITITDGADQNITIAPNGTGKLIINSSGTLANNTFREEIQIAGGYGSGGASFDISMNDSGTVKTTNLKISGKLTVDGDIDPTGLILQGNPGDYSGDTNKLVLYNDSGTLKYKVGNTTSTLAVGSQTGGSGNNNAPSAALADDLKINPGSNTVKLLYQSGNNATDMIDADSGNKYLKAGATNGTKPAFATINYGEINGRLQLGTTSSTALAGNTTTISSAQATAIGQNSLKTSFPGFGTTSGTALAGDTTTITSAQATAIGQNSLKTSFPGFGTTSGTALAGDTTTITSAQATAIGQNSLKTSFPGFGTTSGTALAGDTTTITSAQATAIGQNSLKTSFPGFGTTSGTALAGDTTTISSAQATAIGQNSLKVGYTDALVKLALGSNGGTGGVGGAVETIMLQQNNSNDRTITVGKASGAGQATNLVIKGGEAKSGQNGVGDYNGGNVRIEGGDKTNSGKIGNVNITGNNIELNGKATVARLQATTLFTFPITSVDVNDTESLSVSDLLGGVVEMKHTANTGNTNVYLPKPIDIWNIPGLNTGYAFSCLFSNTKKGNGATSYRLVKPNNMSSSDGEYEFYGFVDDGSTNGASSYNTSRNTSIEIRPERTVRLIFQKYNTTSGQIRVTWEGDNIVAAA